jgi:hypothetical protein
LLLLYLPPLGAVWYYVNGFGQFWPSLWTFSLNLCIWYWWWLHVAGQQWGKCYRTTIARLMDTPLPLCDLITSLPSSRKWPRSRNISQPALFFPSGWTPQPAEGFNLTAKIILKDKCQ